ncbi:hypothetical protein LH935_16385 [Gordonia polyisoprenivorans]|uniref:hypothetical protein n=1 Tax=Gordonia polyisoprenivorans TaxID=84595 RepID=UPI001A0E8B56|nr:hypothetical protein [Gordonia polyisoprenivorans]UZF54325.1 hypothetical protein LH935_16385 [Gordonia polyisoprenivorans]
MSEPYRDRARESARNLSIVLRDIEAGRVDATPSEYAYISGMVAALTVVADEVE